MVLSAWSATLNPQSTFILPHNTLRNLWFTQQKNNKNLLFTLYTPNAPTKYSLFLSIMVWPVDMALPGWFFVQTWHTFYWHLALPDSQVSWDLKKIRFWTVEHLSPPSPYGSGLSHQKLPHGEVACLTMRNWSHPIIPGVLFQYVLILNSYFWIEMLPILESPLLLLVYVIKNNISSTQKHQIVHVHSSVHGGSSITTGQVEKNQCTPSNLVGILSMVMCQIDPPDDMSAADMLTWWQHVMRMTADMYARWAVSCFINDDIWWHLPWHARFALALQMSCHQILPTCDQDWIPVMVLATCGLFSKTRWQGVTGRHVSKYVAEISN